METEKIITEERLEQFRKELAEKERAKATIEKYLRDIRKLRDYAAGRPLTKELILAWRDYLVEKQYQKKSINSFLVSVNAFLEFMDWGKLTVKPLKIQKENFIDEKRELTREEYLRLIDTAQKLGNFRLAMIIMTLCATGVRISELRFLSVACIHRGVMEVTNKGKSRKVILSSGLCRVLQEYTKQMQIVSGPVFCTANGKPVNRSDIWKEMKKLSKAANIDPAKVFPHNFRHLFAKLFYEIDKDLAKLADILGHTSVETTRIYLRTSMKDYRGNLEKMGVIVDMKDFSASPQPTMRRGRPKKGEPAAADFSRLQNNL